MTDAAGRLPCEGEPLVGRFDALLCDLDGVVYAGPHAIDGAPETLERVRSAGCAVMYVTNNASRPPAAVAEHITSLGAPTAVEQVVSSAQAAAALLADRLTPGSPVLITGSAALADEVRAVGLVPVRSQDEGPVAVAQGFDPHLGWEQLAEAAFTLADDSVLWCATNTDRTIPRERGIAPGNGTLVAAVAAASGREPLVAGKPEAPIFREAADRVGATRPAVVGDRLDTDILGAHNAGMESVHVLTGVDSAAAALAACSSQRPSYLLGTLRELFEPYPAVAVAGEGDRMRAMCRQARAEVAGDVVTVTAPHDDLDGWRAACAAWWAARPGAFVATDPEVHWEDPA
ncbi:HAD-IIA family hydrolase [Kocuria tytonis]|uniref:HAD-IIA family hydrolase n=1 Tax=Kocuria tytonis TaxID=2054280 RepID=A0A495AAJ8_9MICC|nr:HAD-IIA family hydrolase [Kocuria tytonis]RKQ37107.1 HAD-IIA family hydrolase [Kocuria tytonis]